MRHSTKDEFQVKNSLNKNLIENLSPILIFPYIILYFKLFFLYYFFLPFLSFTSRYFPVSNIRESSSHLFGFTWKTTHVSVTSLHRQKNFHNLLGRGEDRGGKRQPTTRDRFFFPSPSSSNLRAFLSFTHRPYIFYFLQFFDKSVTSNFCQQHQRLTYVLSKKFFF